MYKANDIAKYIINYSCDNNIKTTNLKLQLLMYYIQAYFISEKDNLLFEAEFVKFHFGPVIRNLYLTYRCYADKPIERQKYMDDSIVFVDGQFRLEKNEFTYSFYKPNEKLIMSTIIESLRNYKPWDLVPIIKSEEPWKSTKNMCDVISNEKIKSYFSTESNKERIFGKYINEEV